MSARDAELDDLDEDSQPPQPETFPEDWDLTSAVMSAVADPETAIELAETAGEQEAQPPTDPPSSEKPVGGQIAESGLNSSPGLTKEIGLEIPAPLPAYLVPPSTSTESDKVQMVTIILRSSQDKVRDNLRIRQIFGTLIAYPGKDRFAFHVFERSRGYLIEFPNFTTQLCPELLSRLKTFIPPDQLRVDEITFQ